MRRFFITSDKFAGSAELLYNEEGCLVFLDFRSTNITIGGVDQLLTAIIPARFTNLEGRLKQFNTLTCVEADFSVTLDDFKHEYPYSRNMHLLPDIWEKMTKTAQVLAWKAAKDYRDYCKRNSWYKPKIAAAWLKAQEYLNDWKNL